MLNHVTIHIHDKDLEDIKVKKNVREEYTYYVVNIGRGETIIFVDDLKGFIEVLKEGLKSE